MNILYDRNMVLGEALFPRLGKAKAVEGRSLTAKALAKIDLLFIRSTCRVTDDLVANSAVRFIGSGVVGTDHIDFAATRARGIKVVSAPGCNAESVANYVIAALLVLGERQQRSWQGATLGIVGVGHVGRLVWKFAEQALGMKVIGCDPPRQEQGDFAAREFISYEALLEQADVITFHVPLTKEGPHKTVGMFSGPIVRKVKPGAVLLNFARGPVCDNALVATMLGAGLLSDAAIDCWEGEPDYSPDLAAVAALTTPHIAGHAYEGKANGTVMVYQEACAFLGVDPGELPAFPPATVSMLEIDCTDKSDEAVLRIAVRATCDIEGDTARFRAAFDGDVAIRKANFDALRKNYPFRRLFSATTLTLINASEALVAKLTAIGFQVNTGRVKSPAKVKTAKVKAEKTKKTARPVKKKQSTIPKTRPLAQQKTSEKKAPTQKVAKKAATSKATSKAALLEMLAGMQEMVQRADYDEADVELAKNKLAEFFASEGILREQKVGAKAKPACKKAVKKPLKPSANSTKKPKKAVTSPKAKTKKVATKKGK